MCLRCPRVLLVIPRVLICDCLVDTVIFWSVEMAPSLNITEISICFLHQVKFVNLVA